MIYKLDYMATLVTNAGRGENTKERMGSIFGLYNATLIILCLWLLALTVGLVVLFWDKKR